MESRKAAVAQVDCARGRRDGDEPACRARTQPVTHAMHMVHAEQARTRVQLTTVGSLRSAMQGLLAVGDGNGWQGGGLQRPRCTRAAEERTAQQLLVAVCGALNSGRGSTLFPHERCAPGADRVSGARNLFLAGCLQGACRVEVPCRATPTQQRRERG